MLFTAGHDTTTAAILFCIYELAINQVIFSNNKSG